MKIDRMQAQNIYDSYAKDYQKSKEKTTTEAQNTMDKVVISHKATDMKDASSLAQKALTADGDRSARISSIKNQIDTGVYSVSSRKVAKSILKGTFFDRKV